jgi:hypothetical protein
METISIAADAFAAMAPAPRRGPIDAIPDPPFTRCLVPAFGGAFLSSDSKDALWARFYTGAPQRQRRSGERYSIVIVRQGHARHNAANALIAVPPHTMLH